MQMSQNHIYSTDGADANFASVLDHCLVTAAFLRPSITVPVVGVLASSVVYAY